MKSEKIYMYGKHALVEALTHAPEVVKKVFLADSVEKSVRELLQQKNISVAPLRGEAPRQIAEEAAHQGVIALIDTATLVKDFEEFLGTLSISKHTSLVLLDELQDPHNVGAIIRSAAALGASAILMPEHNQAPITGAVIKASVGMAFRIPLVRIGNVNQILRMLKDKGFWIYGLAMEGATDLATEEFDAPAAFVIGNEGEGIRQKTLELCDITLAIPMHPRAESLNAAVSAAIVLHAWSMKHPEALQ